MEYELKINLSGAEQAEAKIDSLTSKMNQYKLSTITTLKVGVSDIAKAFEKAAQTSEKFERNLSKVLGFSDKYFKSSFLGYGSGQKPNVNIADPSKVMSDDARRALQAEMQAAMEAAGAGGLATKGQPLPKTPAELAEERELRIRKEATEARRRDLMEKDAKRAEYDSAKFHKDMTFALQPLLNPGSPWGTMFASRQIFSAFMTEKGQRMLGKFGLSGVNGAAIAAGGIVGALTGVGFALKGFGAAVEAAKKAIDRAFKLYTGAAQQGLSTQFYARREALSGLLGINGNPNQIFMFGNAVERLDKQISASVAVVSGNALALANVSVNAKIAKLNLEAIASELAYNAAPALNFLLTSLNRFTSAMLRAKEVIDAAFKGISDALAQVLTGPAGVVLKQFIGQISKALAGANSPLGNLVPFAKQLPASQFERMGLVIGGGMGGGTNDLIRKSNNYLKKIADAVAPTSGIPRSGAWNTSPIVNSP